MSFRLALKSKSTLMRSSTGSDFQPLLDVPNIRDPGPLLQDARYLLFPAEMKWLLAFMGLKIMVLGWVSATRSGEVLLAAWTVTASLQEGVLGISSHRTGTPTTSAAADFVDCWSGDMGAPITAPPLTVMLQLVSVVSFVCNDPKTRSSKVFRAVVNILDHKW